MSEKPELNKDPANLESFDEQSNKPEDAQLELNELTSRPPFDEWWDKGVDVVKNWNNIKKYLNDS